MKKRMRSSLSLVLALCMMLSCISPALAAQSRAVTYAHLEIREATGDLKPGGKIDIPVWVVGLQESQEMYGIGSSLLPMEGLTITGVTPEGVTATWAWNSYNPNPDQNTNHINYWDMGKSNPITADGLVMTVHATIDADFEGESTGITMGMVELSGKKSTEFLNSSDGTAAEKDSDAVLTPVDETGAAKPIVTVSHKKSYTVEVEADKDSVNAGGDVTVTVSIKGGEYAAAGVQLTANDNFTLTSALPTGWENSSTEGVYKFIKVQEYDDDKNVKPYAEGVIGTFTFKADMVTSEVLNNAFTLSKAYVEENADPDVPASTEAAISAPALVDITLNAINITVEGDEPKVVTYNGQAQSFNAITVVTPAEGATVMYGNTKGDYEYNVPTTYTNVGEYTLYYQVTADGYTPVEGELKLTIEEATMEYSATGYNGAYDGTAHGATVTVTTPADGYTIKYGTVEGEYNETTSPTYNKAGTDATIYYQITAPNYTTVTGSVKIVITDAEIVYEEHPYTGVYDGQPHSATVTVSKPEGATVTYRETENGDYTATVPTFTEVGTHTVYYKITADNYTEVTGDMTVEITAKEMSGWSVTPVETATYDPEGVVSATVTTGEPENATVEFKWTENGEEKSSNEPPVFTAAGTYKVTWTITDPNYQPMSGEYTTVISDASITFEVTANETVTYNGEAHVSGEVTSGPVPEDVTVTYTVEGEDKVYNEIPSFTNAGTYTVTWKAEKANYTTATGSYAFTIEKANIPEDWTITGNASVPYDGKEHVSGTVVKEGSVGTVTYSWVDWKTGEPVEMTSQEIPSFTDVGSYNVNFAVSADNYHTAKGQYTFNITQAEITATVEGYADVYDGNAHEPKLVGTLPEGAKVEFKEKQSSGNYEEGYPSITDVGEVIYEYRITAGDNYKTKTGEFTLKVTPAKIEYTVDAYNDIYTGGEHTVVINVTTPETGATVMYGTEKDKYTSTTAPKRTDVGTTTVYYMISVDNADGSLSNYETVTGEATITVTPATFAYEVEAVTGVTYDGQLHASGTVKEGSVTEGVTVTYTVEGMEASNTIPEFTNAGSYTVNWTATKANYKDVTGSYTFVINKKAATITVDNKTKVLGEADPELTYTVTGLVDAGDLGTITAVRGTGETVDTYEITATYTANANYDVTVVPGTFTITAPGFVVETGEYAPGYSIVLVYTNDVSTFSYNDAAMFDVTGAGYTYGEDKAEYDHVYAIVVSGAADATQVKADMTPVAGTVDYNDYDVNNSGKLDLRDIVVVNAVYNGDHAYFVPAYMDDVLASDVTKDKKADGADFNAVKAEYLK